MPPFLLGESHGVARMGLARIFGLCAALLFASSVTAANTIDLGPSDYRSYGSNGAHTSVGVRSSFGQTVRMPPLNTSLTVTRNAVIPYGSIANGLKNFTRVSPASIAASAAITGLFLAVDWAFDDATGSWMKQGIETAPYDENYISWSYGENNNYSTPDEACEAAFNEWVSRPVNAGGVNLGFAPNTATTGSCFGESSRGVFNIMPITRVGSGCASGFTYEPSVYACARTGYIDLDPSDWTTLEGSLPSASASDVAAAGRDVMQRQGVPLPGYHDVQITGPSSFTGPDTTSTSTNPVTGETTVTNTSTQTDISYGPETITTSETTTTTTYENGQLTGETVTTETPGELPVASGVGASGGWPGFCDWATVVCDWLNWTREDPPPEEDLPALVDDDFYTERDISFGSKSCPEPYQVNLAPFMDTQVSVSFQPLCDFAGLIYYMVMAASYIIAAYISIGVARA